MPKNKHIVLEEETKNRILALKEELIKQFPKHKKRFNTPDGVIQFLLDQQEKNPPYFWINHYFGKLKEHYPNSRLYGFLGQLRVLAVRYFSLSSKECDILEVELMDMLSRYSTSREKLTEQEEEILEIAKPKL